MQREADERKPATNISTNLSLWATRALSWRSAISPPRPEKKK